MAFREEPTMVVTIDEVIEEFSPTSRPRSSIGCVRYNPLLEDALSRAPAYPKSGFTLVTDPYRWHLENQKIGRAHV